MKTILGREHQLHEVGAVNVRLIPGAGPWYNARGEVPDDFAVGQWSSMNGILVPPGRSPYDYTGLRCTPSAAFREARA